MILDDGSPCLLCEERSLCDPCEEQCDKLADWVEVQNRLPKNRFAEGP